jgi:hypothetical protein
MSKQQQQQPPQPEYVYEDDAHMIDLLNRHIALGKAIRPPKVGTKRMISARISDVAYARLQSIAKELGYVYNGQGNVSVLLEAIGTDTVQVTRTLFQPRSL